jgi:hypothetical protein
MKMRFSLCLSFYLHFLLYGIRIPTFLSFGYAQDESMHSGADVEAFQAALNRDIGGDASTSQPSDSGNGATFLYFLFSFSPISEFFNHSV